MAFHESGHAVVGTHLGWKLSFVTTDDGGHTRWQRTPDWYVPCADADDRVRAFAETAMAIRWGGHLCEERGMRAEDPAGLGAYEGSMTDRERIVKTANALADVGLAARTRVRAADLLEHRRRDVERVALWLLERRTLRGPECFP